MSRHPVASVTAIVTLLVGALTWPQCLHLRTQFAWHNDPQFSIWRLAWIAHALRVDPHHLFDANIFYPARQTLAYSDATLLEGAVAAPLFWAGVPPILIYNLLLLAGFVGSGVAMFQFGTSSSIEPSTTTRRHTSRSLAEWWSAPS